MRLISKTEVYRPFGDRGYWLTESLGNMSRWREFRDFMLRFHYSLVYDIDKPETSIASLPLIRGWSW